ncbi:MAG TPA: GNAT family N-acetyltransferase [Polyangiaceae bacterium]|nr:GNAT family N-acetyltransferase [Polyangiaceae bacterium]
MKLVECNLREHGPAILSILNDAIVNSTALYDYVPREPDSMNGWFEQKALGGFPVWGAIDAQGPLLGFATYGSFRAWPAYKYSVEHSVYVERGARGRGVGQALMQQLIKTAQEQQYHVLIGGIDAVNAESIAFHVKLGFAHAGTIQQAGFKFGRWLDLAFYQLILPTPHEPRDG